MVELAIFFSVVIWMVAAFNMTAITSGLGWAAFALWITLLARIQQADNHQRKLLAAIEGPPKK